MNLNSNVSKKAQKESYQQVLETKRNLALHDEKNENLIFSKALHYHISRE